MADCGVGSGIRVALGEFDRISSGMSLNVRPAAIGAVDLGTIC